MDDCAVLIHFLIFQLSLPVTTLVVTVWGRWHSTVQVLTDHWMDLGVTLSGRHIGQRCVGAVSSSSTQDKIIFETLLTRGQCRAVDTQRCTRMKFHIPLLMLFTDSGGLVRLAKGPILTSAGWPRLLPRSHLLGLILVDAYDSRLAHRTLENLASALNLLFALSILAMRPRVTCLLCIVMEPVWSRSEAWLVSNLMCLYFFPELIRSELNGHALRSWGCSYSPFIFVLQHLLSQVVRVPLLHLLPFVI